MLVLAVALPAGYVWTTLTWNFSEGERVGYLQKFSRRGWVCKTWEGEMAMVTMPGAIPEKFYFSTRSDAVAAQLNGALGKRVGSSTSSTSASPPAASARPSTSSPT